MFVAGASDAKKEPKGGKKTKGKKSKSPVSREVSLRPAGVMLYWHCFNTSSCSITSVIIVHSASFSNVWSFNWSHITLLSSPTPLFFNVYPDTWTGAAFQNLPSGLSKLQMYPFFLLNMTNISVYLVILLSVLTFYNRHRWPQQQRHLW